MVMTISQAQILINQFSNISINQKVHMASSVVNFVLSPFERNISPGDSQGLKLYLRATNEVDKESDKLDISVSNVKDIIYHFLSLVKKYGWGCLAFMVVTDAGPKIIFRQL